MPVDKAALLGVAQSISPILRLRADELVAIIKTAKKAGEKGLEMSEVVNKIQAIRPKPFFQSQSSALNFTPATLTAEVFADPADGTSNDVKTFVDPGARGEHAFISAKGRAKEGEDDGVFIIKQLGGGRKRKVDEMARSALENLPTAEPIDENVEADEVPLLDDKTHRKAYAKAMDAPKGLGRSQRESVGRSKTFGK
jgi:exosome complex exonuclease RRP6